MIVGRVLALRMIDAKLQTVCSKGSRNQGRGRRKHMNNLRTESNESRKEGDAHSTGVTPMNCPTTVYEGHRACKTAEREEKAGCQDSGGSVDLRRAYSR